MAELVMIRGQAEPHRLSLGEKTLVLGRALDCDLVIMHNMVSRRHAEVQSCADGWKVVDRGSANKVFVNDQPVTDQVLRHGDKVRLGQEIVLSFRDPATVLSQAPAEQTRSKITKISDLRPEYSAPAEHRTLMGIVTNYRDRQKKAAPVTVQRKESFHFFVLFNVAQTINSARSLEEMFSHLLELLVESLKACFGAVLLSDAETGELEPVCVRGEESDGGSCRAVSRTIAEQCVREKVAILTRDAASDPRFMEGKSIAAMQIHSAVCCPVWDGEDVDGVIYLVASETAIFGEADRDLVTAVGHQIAVAIRQDELRRKLQKEATVRAHLSRYHSSDVVDLIMREGAAQLPVREADVTILFADIEGFTPLSQRLPASEVARILNGYFEGATEAIFRHRGQVNKYIGDAILAVFGAPIDNPRHAEDACLAALDMITALHHFLSSLPHEERFRIRISVNSGPVVAGDIGASRRLEYTVIGNTVNVAARLEKCAPPNGIAIGPETARRVKDRFHLRSLGPTTLKGLGAPIEVFVVDGARPPARPPDADVEYV